MTAPAANSPAGSLARALETATASGLVQEDEARLILQWHQGSDRVVAPSERAGAMVREVLEKADFQAKVVIRDSAPKNHPPAEVGAAPPVASEGGRRRSRRRRIATHALHSPRPKSAAARSRMATDWVEQDPNVAARLLVRHRHAVLELVASDALEAHGDEVADLLGLGDSTPAGTELEAVLSALSVDLHQLARMKTSRRRRDRSSITLTALARRIVKLHRLLASLPSTAEVDGEPLSVLAAAREALSADVRLNGMLPPVPQIRVVGPPEDREHLPDLFLPEPTPEERQMILPKMNPRGRESNAVGPAPWLQVFDRLGGHSMGAGRGAPLALRLWVEALAWAPPAARWGALVDVEIEVRDLVEALWPDGWNRGRQLPRLREACAAINGLGWLADAQGRTEWAPVLFRRRPGVAATLGDPVLLQVQLPPVTSVGAGARFNRETLRRLGLHSAPAYRAYLGLVAEWDRRLTGGTRPYTPPRRGNPLPWPGFTPTDRRCLVFGFDETASAGNTVRKRQYDADRAFRALAAHGVIDLKCDETDPRIYRPIRRDL